MNGANYRWEWRHTAFFLLTMSLAWGACSRLAPERQEKNQSQKAPLKSNAAYGTELENERREKDEFFRTGAQSPIPAAQRSSFQGLKYFPVDPGLHYRVKLSRYPQPQPIRIGTNTGEIRSGLRYGYFDFEAGGKSCRLQVYRMEDNPAEGPPFLFIPFKDSTTGSESYGAGRYIEMRENTTGVYDLDFNRAFNPYCAYNPGFSCPVPPEENRLSVPIRAGELTYAH